MIKSIIPRVQNFVSSPKTADIVKNTIIAVSTETTLKMIGRPIFIMSDKEADSPQKKKYAAVKELSYQGICLGIYLSCMSPVKKMFYKVVQKGLNISNPQNKEIFNEFETIRENVANAKKVADEKLKTAAKDSTKEIKENLYKQVENLKKPLKDEKFNRCKGAKELSAIFGSILMLTVVAPQLSHFIIHPFMKLLNMENPDGNSQNTNKKPDKTDLKA